ncbi:MAG: chemotaxis protein CheD [Marinobacter sp.]|uniref:chemotaxis protein CheD n=1 Tax=Marinobacter sp. TaxID=50741 RepID=UPI00299EBC78|nr:chemotaxis protein CheD [Marinobacter sp.]MDX1634870.1 chemotaxis protein CheD [Marinobacter sp.]
MTSPVSSPEANDLTIHVGELLFGRGRRRIRTLLGSCVAITLWHPRLGLGGICHFAIPRRPSGTPGPLSARYGDDCLALFRRSAAERGTRLAEYQGRIFGGGDMLADHRAPRELDRVQRQPVGDANAARAFELLMAEGVSILEADVGEQGYRVVAFDAATGEVQVRFQSLREGS